MSREIRRVPIDWEHPKHSQFYKDFRGGDYYQPMFDGNYDEEAKKWINDFLDFLKEHPPESGEYFWECECSPPDEMYYRNKYYGTEFKSEPTHYQIYETVSEGTPVSPKFATEDEMLQWLMEQGHSEKAAKRFIEEGSVMSGLLVGGRVYSNIGAFELESDIEL